MTAQVSSIIQQEIIDYLKARTSVTAVCRNIIKYDGQLNDKAKIAEFALTLPAILVFYNDTNYDVNAEGNSKYRIESVYQVLVCSNNIASRTSKNDEVLDLKDLVINELTGAAIDFTISSVDYKFNIEVLSDTMITRDADLSVNGIVISVVGMR